MFAPRGWLKRPVAKRIYRTIASSDLFDARWYRSTQVSGLSAVMDPLWHYLDHGATQGLDPSPLFDTSHYVHAHHDVRSSGLNPLFHYLEYGMAERRSPLRSVMATRNALLPETAELETFISPRTGLTRMTVVLDSSSETEQSRSLTEIIHEAQTFAEKQSRSLRVIIWNGAGNLSHTSFPGVVVIEAQRTHPAPTFNVHADEHFLSTSRTSALSLRHVAPRSQLWALSSKKTMDCVPWSSAPALEDLLPHNPSPVIREEIPLSGRIPIQRERTGKILAIFADTDQDPVSYLLALEALDRLFLEKSELGSNWNVIVCGRGVDPLLLAGAFAVRSADHVSPRDIAGLGAAIMTTPDQQVETWCKDFGVPIVSDLSVSGLEATLTGGQP
jgi:hypothetical protein